MFETPANMTLKRKNEDEGPQISDQVIKRVALFAEPQESHDSDGSNTASIAAGEDTASTEEGPGSEQGSSDDVNLQRQVSDGESATDSSSSKASSESEVLPSTDKHSPSVPNDLLGVTTDQDEAKPTESASTSPSQPLSSAATRSPAYQPEPEPAYQPKTSAYDGVVNERRRRSPVVTLNHVSDPRQHSSSRFDPVSYAVDAAAAISAAVHPSGPNGASSNGSSSYPNGSHSGGAFASHKNGYNNPEYEDYSLQTSSTSTTQKEQESDPTYVMFRMYCRIKEASAIVGKKGEKINHLRDKANVRINVSDNLEGVQERIVLVRGPAESVARAFGLIVRTILEEPEDEPASMLSKTYELKILVPHAMVGYIIGKLGSKFREIEENSAAQLKAAEQPLPFSTDRVLTITGVGDAIHIAIYYILQVMIEHKDCLKRNKVIFYNPENARQISNPMGGPPPPGAYGSPGGINSPYMNSMGGPSLMHQNQPYQLQNNRPYNFLQQYQPTGIPQQYSMGNSVSPTPGMSPMGGMAVGLAPVPPPVPQLYTDDHGNIFVGEIITHPPQPSPTNPGKFNQDIFVANENIGSVIGKGGNNIKQIRLNSGCTYVKIEPDQHQQIMISGRGLTNIRKLTLTGSVQAIQMAVSLINQRISIDKERNSH